MSSEKKKVSRQGKIQESKVKKFREIETGTKKRKGEDDYLGPRKK